jgi:hypothetical protein
MTWFPVTLRVWFSPARKPEKRTPRLSVLACDVLWMMVPLRLVVTVARGRSVRPKPSMGPTSSPMKLATKLTCPSSIPRFEREGMVVAVSRRMDVPESEEEGCQRGSRGEERHSDAPPGKLGFTIATPGSPLKAVKEMTLERATLLKMVPRAETLSVVVLIVQVNPGLRRMYVANSVKASRSAIVRSESVW